MNYPYIRLDSNCLQISQLAATHLGPFVSFYEGESSILVMDDPNGIFPLYRSKYSNTLSINSVNIVRYLFDKFGRKGWFCAEYRPITGFSGLPLIISEEPLDAIPLDKRDFTTIDFIPLSRHTSVSIAMNSININTLDMIPHYGPICVLRKNDVFAIAPDPDSFCYLVRQRSNDGVIYSKRICAEIRETSNYFPWLWENNGILFFTTNPKSRRSVQTTAGFIPLVGQRERLIAQSTLSIRFNDHIISIASADAEKIGHNRYYSLFESGDFMAFEPDPNGSYIGMFTYRQNGYHFSAKSVCEYLLDKYGETRRFHLRIMDNRLVFSPKKFERIPSWNTFRKVSDLKTNRKIRFYSTSKRKNLVLPSCIAKYLPTPSPLQIAFYRHKHLWAIVCEENGQYQLQKKHRTVYCADMIPKIQESLQCEDEDYFWTKFDNGILLFSNRRLNDETFDPKIFEKIE